MRYKMLTIHTYLVSIVCLTYINAMELFVKRGVRSVGDLCDTSPCGVRAVCRSDGAKAYACTCPTGYTGDPLDRCWSINPCGANPCGIDAECHARLGKAICSCPNGYEGDPFSTCTPHGLNARKTCTPSCSRGVCLRHNTCGCDPGMSKDHCQKEFYSAAKEGDLNYIETSLPPTNIDPNWSNHQENGTTPLMVAAKHGYVTVVQALVNSEFINLEQTDANIRQTVLHEAAKSNQLAIVRVLLDARANVNAKTKAGSYYTALHYASQNNHPRMVRILLDADANVNARSKGGSTPLMAAAWQGHVNVAKVLLNAKQTGVNLVDENLFTALHQAARYNQTAMARLLLGNGADKIMKDKWGRTPAAVARVHKYNELAKIIDDYQNNSGN